MAYSAIEIWRKISEQAIKVRGSFSVALSGGTSPVGFYQKLSGCKELSWNKTHIFIVDERFVPFKDADSNYRLIKENLLEPLEFNENNIHRMPTEGIFLQDAVGKYEETLKDFFKLKDGDFPEFDLIMLGIGEDGHTASLFPEDPGLLEKEHLTVAVENDKIKHSRISITMPVINSARNVVFLVKDNGTKTRITEEVMQKRNEFFPAAYVRPENGKLFFLINREM